jgi:hypothetical protein
VDSVLIKEWLLARRRKREAIAIEPDPGPDYAPFSTVNGRDYEQYKAQIADNYRDYSNGFAYYEALVEPLAIERSVDIVPLYVMAQKPATERPLISLRHDVDADPDTGLRLARHLARIGLPASFYLLHSANYYGEFFGEVFVRNPAVVNWIRAYVVTGAEIGLHNDALGMFNTHGIDPCVVLQTELAWLRANGAVVRGTVAHNSIVVQGAENYEMFADHVLWPREIVNREGLAIPLGLAQQADFGLDYEGTFAAPHAAPDIQAASAFAGNIEQADIRSRQWMQLYLSSNPCCQWDIDYQIWLLGPDQWVIAGGESRRDVFEWDVDLQSVVQFVRELPASSRTSIVLHPEYFGDY